MFFPKDSLQILINGDLLFPEIGERSRAVPFYVKFYLEASCCFSNLDSSVVGTPKLNQRLDLAFRLLDGVTFVGFLLFYSL